MKERGHASIFIELKNSIITVKHGTDNVVLAQWEAEQGDWDTIWRIINILNAGNTVAVKEF